jgi:hypothetical protein
MPARKKIKVTIFPSRLAKKKATIIHLTGTTNEKQRNKSDGLVDAI